MYLSEVLIRKNNIKIRMVELKRFLQNVSNNSNIRDRGATYNQVLSRLFALIDKYQSHIVLIENSNNNTEITVGESTLSVANAVKLRDTLDSKALVLTALIESGDCSLDILNLMDQREKYLEERIILQKCISDSDRSVKID